MSAILIAVRDFLVALALAWVGVTFEQRAPDTSACTGDSCQSDQSR